MPTKTDRVISSFLNGLGKAVDTYTNATFGFVCVILPLAALVLS